MPQSKEVHKEYMRKYRQGSQEGSQYPALLYAFADPVKRAKLRRICESLGSHGVLQDATYGIGGPTFSGVSEYLAVLT